MTHDYTREAHLAFLSDWVEASYLDLDDGVSSATVIFEDPRPAEVTEVLLSPQLLIPKRWGTGIVAMERAHANMTTVSNCFARLDPSGFVCLAAHTLEVGCRLRVTWRAYGRRTATQLAP